MIRSFGGIPIPSAVALVTLAACANPEAHPPADAREAAAGAWEVDFFDDFDDFHPGNWQDQSIWVNDEDQCYVPEGAHGTREVSDGTLKIRVVDLGEPVECDSYSKTGVQHPPTRYVAGRIISKNRQEFVKGRWTARLRVPDSGQPGMFPAWWLLGALNNEPPTEDEDETVCWPVTGSGEIDVFEHHSDGGPDHYAVRAIDSDGTCGGGDWQRLMHVQQAELAAWHEYGVAWDGADLLFLLDGEVIHRSEGEGDDFPEPLFAILNFAKIKPDPMTVPSWTMEVDWVKHERRVE
ncbi:MAG TPA: family 16 glycosylhydrolase [Longimicrobiales bacterium]|nr:family 16 glycosylhydrolase [Longimicrobiales bacterium]